MLMNIHEYQAKAFLKVYGIPIPRFGIASSVKEAREVAKLLDIDRGVVLKAQVHACGRKSIGGIQMAYSLKEVDFFADGMLGKKMAIDRSLDKLLSVPFVLLSERMDITRELYLAVTIDPSLAKGCLLAMLKGGEGVEEFDQEVCSIPIALDGTVSKEGYQTLCEFFQWRGKVALQGRAIAHALARAFVEKEAILLEINPLIETPEGDLWALDVKCTLDPNSVSRKKELAALYDASQESEQEALARSANLHYVPLKGSVGCLANGAGLGMATIDLLTLCGAEAANFLDMGGGADREMMRQAIDIILLDPKVRVMLIHIFGGIIDCSLVAKSLLEVIRGRKEMPPIILRMEGNRSSEGLALLEGSSVIVVKSIEEGAKRAALLATEGILC